MNTASRLRAPAIAILAPAAATVMIVAPLSPAQASGDNAWQSPSQGRHAARWNPGETSITAGTVAGLRTDWSWTTPDYSEPAECIGHQGGPLQPVVSGGKVFALRWGGVSALDAASGRQVWTTLEQNAYFGAHGITLTAGPGVVIAGYRNCFSPTPSAMVRRWSRVYDAATGKPGAYIPGLPVTTVGNTLISSDVMGDSGGRINAVSRYDLTTGAARWTTRGYTAHLVIDGTVISQAGENYSSPATKPGVYGLRTAGGALRWSRTDLRQVLGGNRAGTQVYATTAGGALTAIEPATGRTIWTSSTVPTAAMSAADWARVLVPCAGGVCAVRQADGQQVYRAGTPSAVISLTMAGPLTYLAMADRVQWCAGGCRNTSVGSLVTRSGARAAGVVTEPGTAHAPFAAAGHLFTWTDRKLTALAAGSGPGA